MFGFSNANAPQNDDKPIVKKNSPKISMAEFSSLETGMTYEQVVSIIGGEGSIGANANVTFQNNSLTSKAQFGLE